MQKFVPKGRYDAEDLETIIRLLRDPVEGCPWDKVQTHESIRKNFVEETYEVLDAIDQKDSHLMQEELGDVMMQVMLHSQMEAEQGHFTFKDVCDGVCKKLIFRHPHIFAGEKDNTGSNSWDALKAKEKERMTLRDELESVPACMPALMRSEKLQKRAERFADEPHTESGALTQAQTLIEALQQGKRQGTDAYGELLFLVTEAARKAGVCAEEALDLTARQFVSEQLKKGK